MQSIKSKIIFSLIRNRHVFKFQLKKPVIDEFFSVQEFRNQIEKASEKMTKIPKDIIVEEIMINSIQGEWIKPKGCNEDNVLLYIHGGGFISGSSKSHRMHVLKFAKGANIKTLLFDYRLAPEHPFPAGKEDCIEVYQWLLEKGYKAENIAIAGESAGGYFTLDLMIALRDRHIELPTCGVAISPCTDLTCQAPSFKSNYPKDIAPLNSWSVWTKMYVGEYDPNDGEVSPLYNDLRGLPPLMIIVGTHEIHYDDAVNFAIKAKEAGVSVNLSIWENMVHAFPIMSPLFKEARDAMGEICTYITKSVNM